MTYALQSTHIQCPYCWENFEIILDCSVDSQEYVEDCEICCRPIVIKVEIPYQSDPQVEVTRES